MRKTLLHSHSRDSLVWWWFSIGNSEGKPKGLCPLVSYFAPPWTYEKMLLRQLSLIFVSRSKHSKRAVTTLIKQLLNVITIPLLTQFDVLTLLPLPLTPISAYVGLKFTYKQFQDFLSNSFFCSQDFTSPLSTKQWEGRSYCEIY